MLRKITLIFIGCFALSTFANSANAMVCPFTDHFSIQAPLPLRIMTAKTGGNIKYDQLNTNNFTLSCADNKNAQGGDVIMTIGMQDDLKCNLTLHDGPYEMNPTITYVDCSPSGGRLFYVGMEHRFGSYDYTIKFTM